MSFQRTIKGGHLGCAIIENKKLRFTFISEKQEKLYSSEQKMNNFFDSIKDHCDGIKAVYKTLKKAEKVVYLDQGNIKFICKDINKEVKLKLHEEVRSLKSIGGHFITCLLNIINSNEEQISSLKEQLQRKDEKITRKKEGIEKLNKEIQKQQKSTKKITEETQHLKDKLKRKNRIIQEKEQEIKKLIYKPLKAVKIQQKRKQRQNLNQSKKAKFKNSANLIKAEEKSKSLGKKKTEDQIMKKEEEVGQEETMVNEQNKKDKFLLQIIDPETGKELPSPITGKLVREHPDYDQSFIIETWPPETPNVEAQAESHTQLRQEAENKGSSEDEAKGQAKDEADVTKNEQESLNISY